MKLKKLLAAVTAAAMAVTTMAFTANAADKDVRLSLGGIGASELVRTEWSGDSFGNPAFELESCWGNPRSLENYNAVEVEYTCSNLSEVMNVYLAIDGGTLPEWTSVWTPPSASGKITLDLSSFRDCTYEVISMGAQPVDSYKLGDTFNPGITVTSAKFVMADKILPTGSLGAAELIADTYDPTNPYENPNINLVSSWGSPIPVNGYGTIELEYTCTNPSEISELWLALGGGTMPEWHMIRVSPFSQGKIVMDLSEFQNCVYEVIAFSVSPKENYSLGDVFDPGITITSAKMVAGSASNIMASGSLGSFVLNQNQWSGDGYGYPELALEINWGNPKSFAKYKSIEVEYTCANLSEVKEVYIAINTDGSTCALPEYTTYSEPAAASGKIVMDLSAYRKYTYATIAFGVKPIESYKIGDIFNPGITITSAKLICAEPETITFTFPADPIELTVGDVWSWNDEEQKAETHKGIQKYIALDAPKYITYGKTTYGELKSICDKFVLEGIDYKNDSANIGGDKFMIYFYFTVDYQNSPWKMHLYLTNEPYVMSKVTSIDGYTRFYDNSVDFLTDDLVINEIGFCIECIENETNNDIIKALNKGDRVIMNVKEAEPETPAAPDNNTPSGETGSTADYPAVVPIGGSSATEQAVEAINSAADGAEIEISIKGNTSVAKDIIKAIAGKDVDVKFTLNGGVTVEINGLDVEKAKKVDLGVKMNKKKIGKERVEELAGGKDTVQFTLKHNGDFGFKATFNLPVNKKYNGKYANIYWDNRGKLEYVGSSKIVNGKASYVTTHASDYVIVVDDYAYGEDVSSAAEFYADDDVI